MPYFVNLDTCTDSAGNVSLIVLQNQVESLSTFRQSIILTGSKAVSYTVLCGLRDRVMVTQVDEVRAAVTPSVAEILPGWRRKASHHPDLTTLVTTLPILPPEPDCFPVDLLTRDELYEQVWWMLYTKSRQEKELMRRLRRLEIAHYAPQIEKRQRSPSGRIRTSFVPLFANYVFMCGDDDARYEAVCTGCVQKVTEITSAGEFLSDLRQIRDLIDLGVPLTIESRLEPGQQVRVRSGSFAGYEGTIIRREQETRLLVCVRFMEQGVSVKLEDCQLEPIGSRPA